jgi:uncharacterized membrane protein YoaK (UPF0700 family)
MTRPDRSRACVLALALAGGVIDAASYLGLGQVFTANMTGNTVLIGVALARGSGAGVARSGTALAGFCAGVAIGAALMRREGGWPARALRALLLEATALVALLVCWTALGSGSARYALISISAAAMGAQSAAARASDVPGVNTTYVTGTLTNAIARLVRPSAEGAESREGASLPSAVWLTYAVGALAGAFAEKAWHAAAVGIALAMVCAVSVVARKPVIASTASGA